MEAEGFLVKVEPHRHSVPFSDRGKVPVEPLLSTQWFVKAEPLAARCREALDRGEPRFVPQRWEKVYRDWLTDIRDWCISRQLWWGHRIPAWFVVSETGGVITDATPYVVARDAEEARSKAEAQFGPAAVLEQDPDVLDTWFSSGLWPFSTLGWPDETSADLAAWYPTSVLVTGFDIIFFWVARMTMMAGAFTGQMPFRDVYIHGLVRDENNRKMSKSAGNGIDPLPLIERYGADALRFALVREVAGAGQDIRLDYDRSDGSSGTVETARNFANKLWNATRFALMNLGGETPAAWASRWWPSWRARTAGSSPAWPHGGAGGGALRQLPARRGGQAALRVRLERPLRPVHRVGQAAAGGDDAGARTAARRVLAHSLEALLVMLHPLMPHLTEELWHAVTAPRPPRSLLCRPGPSPNPPGWMRATSRPSSSASRRCGRCATCGRSPA